METTSSVLSASPLLCGTLQCSANTSPSLTNSLSRYRESTRTGLHQPVQDYSSLHHPSLPNLHLPKGIKLLRTKHDMEEGIRECKGVGVCHVEEHKGELNNLTNHREDNVGHTEGIDGEDNAAEVKREDEDLIEEIEEINAIEEDFIEISKEAKSITTYTSPVKDLIKNDKRGERQRRAENSIENVVDDFSEVLLERDASPVKDLLKDEAKEEKRQERPDNTAATPPPTKNSVLTTTVEASSPETGGLAVQAMASLSCGLGCLLHGSAMVFPAVAIPRY